MVHLSRIVFWGGSFLEGQLKMVSVPFTDPSASFSHSALLSTKASLQLWHKRLGHPSTTIFRKILHRTKLAHSGDKIVNFSCKDCAILKITSSLFLLVLVMFLLV